MSTPFGVIVPALRARRLLVALPLLALVAVPALGKEQPAASKPSAAKTAPKSKATAGDALPATLWIGPKPAKPTPATAPATVSAPIRAEAADAPPPALISAPQTSASPAPAKSVETAAARAPAVVKTAPPVASKEPAVAAAKPLIFKTLPTAAPAQKPVEARKASPSAPKPSSRRVVVAAPPSKFIAPAPRQVVTPAPVVANVAHPQPARKVAAPTAAKAAPQDLDDLPLSSVLSKNTAGEGKSGRSTGNLVADVLTKLGFVILLGLGAAAGWKKFSGQSFARPVKPQQTAEVASVLPLGPQRSVHLLKIGNQTLVVASTPQNISLLATLDDTQAADFAVDANETEADFQALLGQLAQSAAVEPRTKVEPTKVEPVKVEAVEETGGRAFTSLKGSLFSAVTPVSGSRLDA